MRILILSDIHGEDKYLDSIDEEFKKADCVLFAGDFAKLGDSASGTQMLNRLVKKSESVYAVIGNCDEESFIEELEAQDISVQKALVFNEGLVFTGCGGGLKFTGVTPNERTEEDLLSDFAIVDEDDYAFDESEEDNSEKDKTWENMIVVSHMPPKDTKLDVIASGTHVGSETVRNFILEHSPLLAVSGHIHESYAVDTLGKTLIVNPGSFAEGLYAVAEIEKTKDGFSVKSCELKNISEK